MISLARISSKMGKNYYTNDCYYTKEGAIENSFWYGKGSKIHGVEGHVDPKVFQSMLNEFGENRRAALDATFSAPKSVSLACLVGGDKRLLDAHNNAVDRALKILEDRYSYTRVGSRENREIQVTGNILAAKFTHDLSREKDPQLHTHCVIFNKTLREDGNWRAFHNDGVFNNSKLLGLVYQNELAHQVKNIGYDIQTNKKGTFEIVGYTNEQLQEFSKRTQKINALNCKNKKQERTEKLLNRPSKGKAIPRETLLEKWKELASDLKIQHPTTKKKWKKEKVSIKNNLNDALNHVTERDVKFKKEDLEKFILTYNLGKSNFDSEKYDKVIKKMLDKKEILEYKKGFYTTQECLKTEANILNIIEKGKNKFEPILEKIPESITENSIGLTKGQKEALINSFSSKDQFAAWQGVAGAGKTFAMNLLREESEKKNFSVFGFSNSKDAAEVLQNDSKIASTTIAGLLVNDDEKFMKEKKGKGTIWVVDEAGLLGAKDCEKLSEKAVRCNARVILVGDVKQMPAIQSGNPFKLVQDKGIKTSELNESIRQKSEVLKQAVDLVSKNKVSEGLEKIKDKITEIKDKFSKIEFIKNSYFNVSKKERDKTLILCGSNEERNLITKEIRENLKKIGEIKSDEILVTKLVPKNSTEQERKSVVSHQTGDYLVFHKEFKKFGIEKNTTYKITSIDQHRNLLTVHDRNNNQKRIDPKIGGFVDFEPKQIKIAEGDKLRATKNHRFIANGQEFTVSGTSDGSLKLTSKSGRDSYFKADEPLHFDHNYVSTIYSSQGKTCDRVILSGDKSFGKEMIYVGLSRAKFDAVIVTPERTEFLKNAEITKSKFSAMDLVMNARENQISNDFGKSEGKKASKGYRL